eukprot:GILJ01009000.1.p1 GENE.GILJ01009000.1~~GILJ01009000.1.p1  ORF type:complete len:1747 (-),score=226.90 GILJ01009000.1:122-5362(-)
MSTSWRQAASNWLGKFRTAHPGSPAASDINSPADVDRQSQSTFLREALRRLHPSLSLQTRISYARKIIEYVKTRRLDDIGPLWSSVEDLISEKAAEARATGWKLMCAFIEGQSDRLGVLRYQFVHAIKHHDGENGYRLKAFRLLTREGRDIGDLTGDIAALVVEWMREPELQQDILAFLTNIFKYSSTAMDEEHSAHLIDMICVRCNSACEIGEVGVAKQCLGFFDVVVRYGTVPQSSIQSYVCALCRTVNVESQESWQIMKNLLHSNCAYQGLSVLLSVLDRAGACLLPDTKDTISLLRGAVFFIGMATWGSQRIDNFQIPYSAVLPSFCRVLGCKHTVVVYEVVLSVRRLTKKYGSSLRGEWDMVLAILSGLQPYVQTKDSSSLLMALRDILKVVQQIFDDKKFFGVESQLFGVLDIYRDILDEASLLSLLIYRSDQLHPGSHSWLSSIQQLLDCFYRKQLPTKVRLKALMTVKEFMAATRFLYQEELVEHVLMVHLASIHEEPEPEICRQGMEILVDAALHTGHGQFELVMGILDKACYADRGEVRSIAVSGLLSLFALTFSSLPTSKPLHVFILLTKLIRHKDTDIRRIVLECFQQLRANADYQLQWENLTSPFLYCHKRSVTPRTAAILPLGELFDAMLLRLQMDTTYEMLTTVLKNVTNMLLNKFILRTVEVARLCTLLCSVIKDWIQVGRIDVLPDAFRNLTLLSGYKEYFTVQQMEDMVKVLVLGLYSPHNISDRAAWERLCPVYKSCLKGLSMLFGIFPDCSFKFLPAVLSHIQCMTTSAPPIVTDQLSFNILDFLFFIGGLSESRALSSDVYTKVFSSLLACAMGTTEREQFHRKHLAYRGLATWFVRCPLKDRPLHFEALSDHLYAQVRIHRDRLAESTLELLSWYAHSNADRICSPLPAIQSDKLFGADSPSATWVKNRSLISIRTGTLGYAEVIIRRPTGVVRWLLRFQNPEWSDEVHPIVRDPTHCLRHMGINLDLIRQLYSDEEDLRQKRESTVEHTIVRGPVPQLPVHDAASSGRDSPDLFCSPSSTGDHNDLNIVLTYETNANSPLIRGRRETDSAYSSEPSRSEPESFVPVQLPDSIVQTKEGTILMSQQAVPDDLATGQAELNRSMNDGACSSSSVSPLLTVDRVGSKDDPLDSQVISSALSTDGSTVSFHSAAKSASSPLSGRPVQQRSGSAHSSHRNSNTSIQSISVCSSISSSPVSASPPSSPPLRPASSTHNDLSPRSITSPPPQLSGQRSDREKVSPVHRTTSPVSSSTKESDESNSHRSVVSYFELDELSHQFIFRGNIGDETDILPRSAPLSPSASALSGHDDSDQRLESYKLKHSPDMKASFVFNPLPSYDEEENESPALFPTVATSLGRRNSVPLVKEVHSPADFRKLKSSFSSSPDDRVGGSEIGSVAFERSVSPTADSTRDSTSSRAKELEQKSISPVATVPLVGTNISSSSNRRTSVLDNEESSVYIDPTFVFSQLQYISVYGSDGNALPVPVGDALDRAINVLDRTPCVDTHKIGLLYVGVGQKSEEEILSNQHGSPRYLRFLHSIGQVVRLKDCIDMYTGGLDRKNDSDGEFSIYFKDPFSQVMFHVATLMPGRTHAADIRGLQKKKRYIGNDFVSIIYSESPSDYNQDTIPGDCNFVHIVLYPLEEGWFRVEVKMKKESLHFGPLSKSHIVPEHSLATLVRQTAVNANLAVMFLQNNEADFVSNWQERLSQIKRIQERLAQPSGHAFELQES